MPIRARRRWKSILGAVVVATLLWLVFRDIDAGEVRDSLLGAHVGLLLASAGIAMVGFVVRAIRWRRLLAPVQSASPFSSRFAAVAVGFMANNLLPSGRVGELGRAYAYSRLEPVGVAPAIATLVVERLLDGVAILALLAAAMASPGFPADELSPDLRRVVHLAATGLALALAAAILVVALPGASVRACAWIGARARPRRLAERLAGVAEGLVQGLSSMRNWRHMAPAALWSVGLWTLQSLSFWVGFRAFGIDLPFAAALVANAAVAVMVAVPAAPGYVGTFQVGMSLALVQVYGVADASALAFAVGWHVVNFFPITLLGLWHCRRIGLGLGDLRSRTEAAAGGTRADAS